MKPESFLFPFERPVAEAIKAWGDKAVSFTLVGIAIFILFIALRTKDHLTLKAVLLAWIMLP